MEMRLIGTKQQIEQALANLRLVFDFAEPQLRPSRKEKGKFLAYLWVSPKDMPAVLGGEQNAGH